METGSVIWKVQVPTDVGTAGDTGNVYAHNDSIVMATDGSNFGNNAVVALDMKGGLKWRFKMDYNVYNFQVSDPGDGSLVFMDLTGTVYRVDRETGKQI